MAISKYAGGIDEALKQWAISTMRREGLAVPRSMLAEAKTYVSECIKADGGKIERHVRRFAG